MLPLAEKHFPIELFEPLISQGLDAGQPLSIPDKIPLLFHLFPTEILISIKPPEIYRQAYVYSWVNIVAILALVRYVNFT